MGRKSQCFYDFTSKHLLTAELIGKFQRIFPCLQEGCCVQTSQDLDDLTTEPLYPCLKLNLELDVLDFHGSQLCTEEGAGCRGASIAPLLLSAELPLWLIR